MNTIGEKVLHDSAGFRIGTAPTATTRITKDVLGGMFGKDKRCRLIVSLLPGDVLELRPERTQRPETCLVKDVYAWLLRTKAGKAQREKIEARKAKRKETLERRRIAAADKRMSQIALAERTSNGKR